MAYSTVQFRVTSMIYKKGLRDDNGNLFGFGTHIYRHYYGVKDGRRNMSKYEKMVACNRKSSLEKIDLAKKAIFETLDDGEKITVPKLMAKTDLSMAMGNEIEALYEKIRSLQEENRRLIKENEKLQKALNKKNASLLRRL